jgi:hypothetical protein
MFHLVKDEKKNRQNGWRQDAAVQSINVILKVVKVSARVQHSN